MKEKPHGIMFHYFHDDAAYKRGPGSLSAEDLERVIRYCQETYHLLSADEWLYKEKRGALDPRDVFLSFDDCIRSEYEIAYPVLQSYHLKALWFVYTSVFEGELEMLEVYRHFRWEMYGDMEAFYDDFFQTALCEQEALHLDIRDVMDRFDPAEHFRERSFYTDRDRMFRYMRDEILTEGRYNWMMDQLIRKKGYDIGANRRYLWITEQELKKIICTDGHIAGLHTHTHPTFTAGLSRERQEWEYGKNREVLERILGVSPACMAHPCNSYNADTLDILKGMGIETGFRATMGDGYTSRLEYARKDSTDVLNEMRGQKDLCL